MHFGAPVEHGNQGKNTKSGKISLVQTTQVLSVYNHEQLLFEIVAAASDFCQSVVGDKDRR